MSNTKDRILDRYGFHSERELKLTDFLFLDCNNSCDFCFEKDHEFKSVCSGIPTLCSLDDRYIDSHLSFIAEVIKTHGDFNKVKFTVMGGELFMSGDLTMIDYYFTGLMNVFDNIRDKISVQIVSNLIHDNIGYVVDLLLRFRKRGIKYILNTSFDFGDVRFGDRGSYDRFKRNINQLVRAKNTFGLNVGCGIILTTHMLESLKRKDDQCSTFEFICDNFNVDFARLSGNFSYKLTYDEMVELLMIVIDRYPDLVENAIYKERSEPRCCLNNKHILITGNRYVEACVSYVYSMFDKSCEMCKNDEIMKRTKKYGCLSCPYFGHCIP